MLYFESKEGYAF